MKLNYKTYLIKIKLISFISAKTSFQALDVHLCVKCYDTAHKDINTMTAHKDTNAMTQHTHTNAMTQRHKCYDTAHKDTNAMPQHTKTQMLWHSTQRHKSETDK
jgi:hypothetical protein